MSEYGTDRYGNPFPVYFANGPSGQSALYVYVGVNKLENKPDDNIADPGTGKTIITYPRQIA